MRHLIARAVLVASFLAPLAATAEDMIFKYSKPDGTVMYTDKLSDLPPQRRAYYNQILEERRKQEEEEAKRARAAGAVAPKVNPNAAQIAGDRQRAAELDARLAEIKRAQDEAKDDEQSWRKRVKEAKATLQRMREQLVAKQEEWSGIALQGAYALPGQAEKREQLEKELKELEAKIDAQIDLVFNKIPAEARAKGIPPGWLRER